MRGQPGSAPKTFRLRTRGHRWSNIATNRHWWNIQTGLNAINAGLLGGSERGTSGPGRRSTCDTHRESDRGSDECWAELARPEASQVRQVRRDGAIVEGRSCVEWMDRSSWRPQVQLQVPRDGNEHQPHMKPDVRCTECGTGFAQKPSRGRPSYVCSSECRLKRTNRIAHARRSRNDCPPHLHGTLGGYTNFLCKCSDCKSAFAAYRRDLRKRKTAA